MNRGMKGACLEPMPAIMVQQASVKYISLLFNGGLLKEQGNSSYLLFKKTGSG
jgi:hypothetical protein